MNDPPIHLLSYANICKPHPHSEPSVTVPVWITQSSLDGLNNLIRFLEGLSAGAGQGTIPGAFELTMFYRTIRSSISEANKPPEKSDEWPKVEATP